MSQFDDTEMQWEASEVAQFISPIELSVLPNIDNAIPVAGSAGPGGSDFFLDFPLIDSSDFFADLFADVPNLQSDLDHLTGDQYSRLNEALPPLDSFPQDIDSGVPFLNTTFDNPTFEQHSASHTWATEGFGNEDRTCFGDPRFVDAAGKAHLIALEASVEHPYTSALYC
jgi:hypothetical protein